MCDICRAVPSDFIVLSGDDALTLPLMGWRAWDHFGRVERDSAEMVQMVEAAGATTLPPPGRFTVASCR